MARGLVDDTVVKSDLICLKCRLRDNCAMADVYYATQTTKNCPKFQRDDTETIRK